METFHNVACTVCGCVCDDLTLTFDAGQLVQMERACDLARPNLLALNNHAPPAARIAGKEASVEFAVAEAARLLTSSRAPLIYGLSRSSTPGQRAALSLADRLGAIIDTTASVCHGPSIMAIQQVGESTSTLGEVARRGDLVVFWGANPAVTHPRHFERYSLDPASDLLPRGRADRHVVVIDIKETATTAQADEFIQVDPGRDFELITSLRQLVRNPGAAVQSTCDVDADRLKALAERMRACRYGVVFFGLGLARTNLGHLTVEILLELVAELNVTTRFVARRLRIPGDVSGADSVLCWQTGFPFGVDLSRGFPRYNPGEYTAEDLLLRREVDACVIVGSESLSSFSPAAIESLARIPTIILDPPHAAEPPTNPAVQLTTAVYGIHAAGTAYRMDEVPIPLRKLIDSPYATDADILSRIAKNLTPV